MGLERISKHQESIPKIAIEDLKNDLPKRLRAFSDEGLDED